MHRQRQGLPVPGRSAEPTARHVPKNLSTPGGARRAPPGRPRWEQPMDIIARLDHVTKTYGSVVALDSVSVTIPPGVTAVLGPNGAGKSTMIEIFAGLRRPSAGRVRSEGRRVGKRCRTGRASYH